MTGEWDNFSADPPAWTNAKTGLAANGCQIMMPGSAGQAESSPAPMPEDVEVEGSAMEVRQYGAAGERREVYFTTNAEPSHQINCTTVSQKPSEYKVKTSHLPWKAEKAYCMTLDDADAQVFTTPRLNGCGITIAGSRQQPFVVHANYDGQDKRELMGADQKDAKVALYVKRYAELRAELVGCRLIGPNDNPTMFDPSFYGENIAQVFGLKGHDGWTIYYNIKLQNTKTNKTLWYTGELWPNLHQMLEAKQVKDFLA